MTREEEIKAQIATQLLCAARSSVAGLLLQTLPQEADEVEQATRMADRILEQVQVKKTVPLGPVAGILNPEDF
jgi:redox-regulated HSP33 family molecular chaperone